MGTPDFAVPALNALVEAGRDVVAVYTQPPRPGGRGKQDRKSPIHQRSETLGLRVFHPTSLKDEVSYHEFTTHDADVSVVAAYGLILPQGVLDTPQNGCLNIHASLLPRWRGAAPIHRAIMSGDAETGVCIMQMEVGLDTGPVLMRQKTPIGDTDTTGELHDRLASMGAEMIVEALSTLDSLEPTLQSERGVTYAEKIDKSEARVDWAQSANSVARHINGLAPFPGAWTKVHGERLKLLRARPSEGSGEPGIHLGGFRVACETGSVDVLEAQRPGKRPMTTGELLRGLELPTKLP